MTEPYKGFLDNLPPDMQPAAREALRRAGINKPLNMNDDADFIRMLILTAGVQHQADFFDVCALCATADKLHEAMAEAIDVFEAIAKVTSKMKVDSTAVLFALSMHTTLAADKMRSFINEGAQNTGVEPDYDGQGVVQLMLSIAADLARQFLQEARKEEAAEKTGPSEKDLDNLAKLANMLANMKTNGEEPPDA